MSRLWGPDPVSHTTGGAMSLETRTTDSKGRLVLPREFANATVILERVSETEIRVRRARVVPEDELGLPEKSASRLSDRDRDLFLELLAKPPKPNVALKNAARRQKSRLKDRHG